jgi:hypothetical protein
LKERRETRAESKEAAVIELGVAMEGPGIAGEARAIVLEPARANFLHVGELLSDRSAAGSQRSSVEALFRDGAHELEVDGVVDAPGLEDLFEQGAAVYGDSRWRLTGRIDAGGEEGKGDR